ncbi:hypothetical protein SAY86_022590 [Trapa natans]|uniref:Gnk2-homologous domain-containing protein n=1 Tax=Trapa natans TaxID=22666 RepID=A0AAN7R8I7_TRANT|nr:hypothetical protein SAY86_022590 [Trapa natans]
MSWKTFTLFVLVVSCSFILIQTVHGADPLFHFCSSSSGNFTSGSPYEANLNKLTSFLYLKTPPTGFGEGSIGQHQDQSYGLALCRGDVSAPDCKTCVATAGDEIRKRCPLQKEAVIWYDNCLFKYSDKYFFGKIDTQYVFYLWNLNVVNNSLEFNQKTKELLTQLTVEAYVTPKLYATGESELDESTKLYGLVQCTRDLSAGDCKKCLDDAIGRLPSCCDGKQGGRVVGGSCNFRYEIYPFVNA